MLGLFLSSLLFTVAHVHWCLSPLRAVRCADVVCLSSPYFLISSSCSIEFVVPLGFTYLVSMLYSGAFMAILSMIELLKVVTLWL